MFFFPFNICIALLTTDVWHCCPCKLHFPECISTFYVDPSRLAAAAGAAGEATLLKQATGEENGRADFLGKSVNSLGSKASGGLPASFLCGGPFDDRGSRFVVCEFFAPKACILKLCRQGVLSSRMSD